MNINIIKEEISKNLGKQALIKVYGMRNKVNKYEGIIYKVYPNIFTVLINNEEKSFCYRDIIIGDVKIFYR